MCPYGPLVSPILTVPQMVTRPGAALEYVLPDAIPFGRWSLGQSIVRVDGQARRPETAAYSTDLEQDPLSSCPQTFRSLHAIILKTNTCSRLQALKSGLSPSVATTGDGALDPVMSS